jgi:DNA invertase Pin-like site-specific DNA recombinase
LCLGYLLAGDTLVVWRLDRLGRSLRHLVETVNALADRGVAFASLHEGIDTSTSTGRLVFHIFVALAEFERELIAERAAVGRQAARARGAWAAGPPNCRASRSRSACDEDWCRILSQFLVLLLWAGHSGSGSSCHPWLVSQARSAVGWSGSCLRS